jgi:predicted  nucleic acid-binding Zn-ribbon protein
MNIFDEYKSAVDSHNALNSQLEDLFEELAEAKTLYILPITERVEALQSKLNEARERYAKAQDNLHEYVVNGSPTEHNVTLQ